METHKQVVIRGGEMKDLFSFLWKNKLWFLIPFIFVLLLFSIVLIFASATGIAPFVYTLI